MGLRRVERLIHAAAHAPGVVLRAKGRHADTELGAADLTKSQPQPLGQRDAARGLDARAQNLLNTTLWPSGSSSVAARQSADGGETLRGERYYFPEAGRSVWVSMRMEW